MPRQTLILDSSQISSFLECPQLHNYAYTQSLVQINQFNPALTLRVPDKMAMGTLGHKYLELYYRTLGANPDSPESAVRAALDFDPDKADTIDPEFPLSAELRQKVRERFREYLLKYGTSDYTVLTRPKKYTVTTFPPAGDPMLQDVWLPEPLVEQGFSYKLYESSEYLFVLEGRIDFIGSANGEMFWMDHKWQLRERELYKKSIQFRNYALVTGFPLGVINYVRLHDKLCAKTFIRQPISFSAGESAAWKTELIEIYVSIAKQIQSGTRILNRSACAGKYGYPCEFTPLCESYNPRQRQSIQFQNYTKKKEWRPW